MSRIRANKITNQAANGAPVCEQGLIVTGILTATGNISVGGTLTYEDVTNVDSVGVITARSTIDAQGDVSIADKIIHSGDTNTAIRFPAADTISFETAGTERLRIDSSGLIGIGLSVYADTSASEYDGDANNLVVGTGSGNEGITILSGQNVSNYGSIFFADGTGATNSKRGQLRYEQNNEVMSFYTAGVEKVRINAAGNVGIGTDDPQEILHIHEDGTGPCDVRISNNEGYGFLRSDSNLLAYNAQLHLFANRDRTTEYMRITNQGQIGIGTISPTEQLEIYNGASSGNSTFRMRSLDGSTHLSLDARGTNASNMIYFTDSSAVYNSFINRSHSSNANFAGLKYAYNGSAHVAFRISESGGFEFGDSGNLLANSGNYGTAGQVLKSNGNSPPSWSGGAQRVLEVVASPCDGSTIATSNGNITFPNVTGPQDLSTSYANVQGSIISYQPPSGTTQVIYEFNMQVTNHDDAISIGHFKFYIDGSEVVYARRGISAEDVDVYVNFKYVINIGGSANANTGRIASWSSAKEMKMTAREYHSTNNAISLHETDHWDGAGTNMFSQPVLHITAIGV